MRPLLKNPKKCPIICFATDKKIIPCTFRIRGTLIFCMSLSEGEIKDRKRKRKRKREKEKVQAIIFLNRPGQNKKSANYI
jgi:hypothetical protein